MAIITIEIDEMTEEGKDFLNTIKTLPFVSVVKISNIYVSNINKPLDETKGDRTYNVNIMKKKKRKRKSNL